jgi:D-inositol-3-phosphate glycosyltransferase
MYDLRIAMISEHASPVAELGGVDAGGQNVHVARLAEALARRGHQVTVYTRRDSPYLPDVAHADGYTVEHVPAGPPCSLPQDDLLPYMANFGGWLARRWAGSPPDVIHAHFWTSAVAALVADPRHRLPLVVTYHALGSVKRRMLGDADPSPPSRLALEAAAGRSADRVIAQCSDEARELEAYGLTAADLSIVPSGVDTELFHPPETGTRPRGDRPARILTVGRMVRRKGFADLVQAMPLLPSCELLIAGGSPDAGDEQLAAELRELARDLDVADRVRLLGALDQQQMAELYRSVDVLACAPQYEPFGMTPLEAMASGVPVVGYAVGGLPDSIVHGETGLLTPPGQPPQLAAALRRLLGDEPARLRYADAAVRRARSHYPWERIAARVEAVYIEAAKRRAAAKPTVRAVRNQRERRWAPNSTGPRAAAQANNRWAGKSINAQRRMW